MGLERKLRKVHHLLSINLKIPQSQKYRETQVVNEEKVRKRSESKVMLEQKILNQS